MKRALLIVVLCACPSNQTTDGGNPGTGGGTAATGGGSSGGGSAAGGGAGGGTANTDGGGVDAGAGDGGVADAGSADGGSIDSGVVDAGPEEFTHWARRILVTQTSDTAAPFPWTDFSGLPDTNPETFGPAFFDGGP